MYHALTLNGYSDFINAVKRQRNLGLGWNIHGFHVDKINEVLANNNYDIFGIVESWTSGYSYITVHATKGPTI